MVQSMICTEQWKDKKFRSKITIFTLRIRLIRKTRKASNCSCRPSFIGVSRCSDLTSPIGILLLAYYLSIRLEELCNEPYRLCEVLLFVMLHRRGKTNPFRPGWGWPREGLLECLSRGDSPRCHCLQVGSWSPNRWPRRPPDATTWRRRPSGPDCRRRWRPSTKSRWIPRLRTSAEWWTGNRWAPRAAVPSRPGRRVRALVGRSRGGPSRWWRTAGTRSEEKSSSLWCHCEDQRTAINFHTFHRLQHAHRTYHLWSLWLWTH